MASKWTEFITLPSERSLQLLSAFTFIMMIMFIELACLLVTIIFWIYGNIIIRTCIIMYLLFMYIDRKAGENCSRGQGSEIARNWFIWRHFTKYFPITIVKTVDLPPTKNYLFATFPHGVISMSVFGNFATSTTTFKQLFPGIRSKCATLNFHFFSPIFREIVLSWGMISVKKCSIKTALTQPNDKISEINNDGYTSNAVILMVGGAREALNARPGNYKLVLKERKGFIKIALETGAALVPVFSFGEVEVYDQPANPPGSKLRKFQETIKRITTVAPIFFIGRGFFPNSYGPIPYRQPLTTVVGAPINVVQTFSPKQEEIDKLHAQFCSELENLFETHKQKYIKNHETVKLIIE